LPWNVGEEKGRDLFFAFAAFAVLAVEAAREWSEREELARGRKK
jgi:hypothetical protein